MSAAEKLYKQAYYAKNKYKWKEYQKRSEQKPERKAYLKQYYIDNKDKIQDRIRIIKNAKYKTDPNFRLRCVLRSRLNAALKGKGKGRITKNTVALLGCDLPELRKYLESKFSPGMSWGNYGHSGNVWHIDHIVPICKFDLADPIQAEKACHYTNLQPLWAKDNIKKGGR